MNLPDAKAMGKKRGRAVEETLTNVFSGIGVGCKIYEALLHVHWIELEMS